MMFPLGRVNARGFRDGQPLDGYLLTDFGSLGDDPGQNKQTWDKAMEYLEMKNGGRLIYPAQRLLFPRVTLVPGVILQGHGAGVSQMVLEPTDFDGVDPSGWGGVLNARGTPGDFLTDIHVCDLMVDGNRGAHMNVPAYPDNVDIEAIDFERVERCSVRNVHAVRAVADGIDFDLAYHCHIADSWAYECGINGIHPSVESARCVVYGNFAFGNDFGISGHATLENMIYVGNVCYNNVDRNWRINEDFCIWWGNQSIAGPDGPANEDSFAGVDYPMVNMLDEPDALLFNRRNKAARYISEREIDGENYRSILATIEEGALGVAQLYLQKNGVTVASLQLHEDGTATLNGDQLATV